jgi:hypothetical protein
MLYLPGQQEKEGLEAPSASIDIITVEYKETILRGKSSLSEEKDEIMQLAMKVSDDDDSAGVVRVNSETIGFLVENL